MRSVLFILILLFLGLTAATQSGLAEESRLYIYRYDFNQPSPLSSSQPWEQTNGEVRFDGGDPKQDYFNLFPQRIAADFRMEVRSFWRDGATDGGFGIVYRYSDPSNYFSLQVTNDGRFRIVKVIKGFPVELMPWKHVSILGQDASNMIGVLCTGDKQRLYINNTLVAVVTDGDFSQNPVLVGLIAHGNLQCGFDDLIVEGVTASERAPFTDRPFKKVDFSFSSQGFSLQPPWRIEFGRFIFAGGPQAEYINVPLDEYAKPLTVSVRTNWIGKSKDKGYGLVFDFKDESTYNVFQLTAQGNYRISRKFRGQWTDLIPLKPSTGFKERVNILSVEYTDKTVNFAVNGVVEANIPINMLTSIGYIKAGLYAEGNLRCSFDDFTVQENSFDTKAKPVSKP